MKTGSFPKIGVMPAAPQYPLLNPRSDDEQMVYASPISRARNGCRAGYHFFGQPISKCCFSLPRAVISERKLCDCTVDLRAYLVRLFWKDQQQQPYAGFDHLPRKVEDGPIDFAMNAGMYEEEACM